MMKRFVIWTMFLSYCLLMLPAEVLARRLPPADFEQMYRVAASGDLGALMAASSRGLDLNAKNSNGDTGVCAAIKRNDYMAYNTFIKAGAFSKPGCISLISASRYNDFMASPHAIEYSRYPRSFIPRENQDWIIVGATSGLVAGLVWLISEATK